ncbi:type II toxin-antitoxin system RelE/ParE family toxin [Undibacterium sp. TC9W]|uniref:type II toxin-antitoxin system RelE/ParE family toxin n=1 Tax=Undibacterium sp. TC9W TaxID=3413053 RepID=UPI003BF03F09
MATIFWKKLAINDLIKIGQYIAKNSPANAQKLVSEIEGKVTRLAVYPQMGKPGRKRGTRELVAHDNYFVVYRVLAKKVEILRVKHVAQQWP